MFFAKVNDFLESRTLSGESPSDLEWQGFPTPQPGKTKYSSLSQISLRINKKSSVAHLVPLNPLVTSPNICCHPALEWKLFQGLESPIPYTILQGAFNCGPSSHPDFIKNYFLLKRMFRFFRHSRQMPYFNVSRQKVTHFNVLRQKVAYLNEKEERER